MTESLQYLDVSKHIDTLESRYTLNRDVITDGTRLDWVISQYAQAVADAKRQGKDDQFPELVPITLHYEGSRSTESSTHITKSAMPALSKNGKALLREQLGGTVNSQSNYAVLVPSNDLPKFENTSNWTVEYTPEAIAQAMLNRNFLDPQIWSDEGNPVAREAYFRVLNQSPALDEGEKLEWQGEPNSNELLAAGVQRDQYTKLLQKIAGEEIDEEAERESLMERDAKAVIRTMPRQKKIDLIDEHDVETERVPHFVSDKELVEAIYDQLGDIRDLDDFSDYTEPEMEQEQ